jgi:hypothetical protein
MTNRETFGSLLGGLSSSAVAGKVLGMVDDFLDTAGRPAKSELVQLAEQAAQVAATGKEPVTLTRGELTVTAQPGQTAAEVVENYLLHRAVTVPAVNQLEYHTQSVWVRLNEDGEQELHQRHGENDDVDGRFRRPNGWWEFTLAQFVAVFAGIGFSPLKDGVVHLSPPQA